MSASGDPLNRKRVRSGASGKGGRSGVGPSDSQRAHLEARQFIADRIRDLEPQTTLDDLARVMLEFVDRAVERERALREAIEKLCTCDAMRGITCAGHRLAASPERSADRESSETTGEGETEACRTCGGAGYVVKFNDIEKWVLPDGMDWPIEVPCPDCGRQMQVFPPGKGAEGEAGT